MLAIEDEETGLSTTSNEDIIAQYQTTRIRSFWSGYKRFVVIIDT